MKDAGAPKYQLIENKTPHLFEIGSWTYWDLVRELMIRLGCSREAAETFIQSQPACRG